MTGGYGEVKPLASTPAGKPRVAACEPDFPPSRGSRPQPWPSYHPCISCLRMLQNPLATPTAHPLFPTTSTTNVKKTKTFGLVSCHHLPNRVARYAHNPALKKDQPPGRLLAHYKRLHAQYTMTIVRQTYLGKKTKAFGLVSCHHLPNRVARYAHNPAL